MKFARRLDPKRAAADLSEQKVFQERIIAGAALRWEQQESGYLQRLVAVCPTSFFSDCRAKEILEACLRLASQNSPVDLPAVACELSIMKAVCSHKDAAEMMTQACNLVVTRQGGLMAAQFVAQDHMRLLLLEKTQSAFTALQSGEYNPVLLQDIGTELSQLAESGPLPTATKHPLEIDAAGSSAVRFLQNYPPSFDWLLKGSLIKGDLGLITGAPGVGKSTFSLHLLASLASGSPLLDSSWTPTAAYRCAYISAEDSEAVLQRRVFHILHGMGLPKSEMLEAAEQMHITSVTGDVALFENGEPTRSLSALKASIKKMGAQLYVLDNLARFAGCDENDNVQMTRFCAEIEALCKQFSCNIILLHHCNKAAGDCLNDSKSLEAALNQTSIRGASAIAGCARWVLSLASIGSELASKMFGPEAQGKYPGTYVAARVSKKNTGAPEARHCFERREHGLLHRVDMLEGREPGSQEGIEDAHKLAEEVLRRKEAGEKPLSVSKGGREVFGWGAHRARRASERALELGLLSSVPKGAGSVLGPTVPVGPGKDGTVTTHCNIEQLAFGPSVLGPEGWDREKSLMISERSHGPGRSPLKGGERDRDRSSPVPSP